MVRCPVCSIGAFNSIIDLLGYISSEKERLESTFNSIIDLPGTHSGREGGNGECFQFYNRSSELIKFIETGLRKLLSIL